MIKLSSLFEDPKPWIFEIEKNSLYNEPIKDKDGYYHYVYCWVNVDKDVDTYQWCYVGKHKSWSAYNEDDYWGSCGNLHYWNSRKLHEYKCIILGYTENEDSMSDLEARIVNKDLIQSYHECGIFNVNPGGRGSWHSATKRKKELYPDTNGTPPQNTEKWIESGLTRLKVLYPETNGMPPGCYLAANKRRKELYPDTNGAPTEWIEAGSARLKELYPETNGMPIECFEAGHTPEAIAKQVESNKRNHGGVLACNTLEANISRVIKYINKNISRIKAKGLELTEHNYFYNCSWKNWYYIKDNISTLRSDPRWTPEMEQIFKDINNIAD